MENNTAAVQTHSSLKPTLGIVGLAFFGIGNMLGAGIYGLIGQASAIMGNAVWISLLAAVTAAGCTGLTYASLGSRFPRAGGAAYITRRTFGHLLPAYVIGLAVGMSGLVSMAAGSHVFADYAGRIFDGNVEVAATGDAENLPFYQDGKKIRAAVIIAIYITVLGCINLLGMRQSSALNILCTVIEAFGLLLVIFVGLRYWGSVNYLDATTAVNETGTLGPTLILGGAALMFYAFIGFEDVLNVSEEVKKPQTTIPIAIIIAMTVTTLIYMAVAITAVSVVPAQELAKTKGALALVIDRAAPSLPRMLLPSIALFAVANTGLLNFIMSSRMIFGMARDGMLPKVLASVHPQRQTPFVAIILCGGIVLLMAVPFNLGILATVSGLLLLTSFITMNVCMIILKWRPDEPKGAFEVPTFVPIIGIVVSASLILNADPTAIGLAALLLAILAGVSIGILFFVRPSDEQALHSLGSEDD